MEIRVAVISILVEEGGNIEQLNRLLHEYADYIQGRMGVPCRKYGVHIISIAIGAPQNVINSLAGKIGRIAGITAKATYSSHTYPVEE